MNIKTFFTLTSFLLNSSRLPKEPKSLKNVREERDIREAGGQFYDLYKPAKSGARKLIIVLPGITINGKQDIRLMRFAKCLAQHGLICIVPQLPGLAEGDFQIEDITILKSLIEDMNLKYQLPVGLIGFSFGGTYALIAAVDDKIKEYIDFIVTFGACYSLALMFEEWLKNDDDICHDDDTLNNRIYTQLFYAKKYSGDLSLDGETVREIESLLKRYCSEASIEEKKEFYDARIRKLKITEKACTSYDQNVLEYLSLTGGKLGKIKARVNLIHDISDTVVTSVHSSLIYEELLRNDNGGRHRLLLTSLISHVAPGRIKVKEIIGFYQSLELLFN